MASRIKRIYDRLPLEVAQVLRDAQAWREHQRNHEEPYADMMLGILRESVDVLNAWEARQDPDYRAGDVGPIVAKSENVSSFVAKNPDVPKKALHLVTDEDE